MGLLILMIVGATIGELPVVKEAFPEIRLDMFFFVCITTIIMAWTKIFPPKKYTKYISWDILITIACAFAISKAMENSGFRCFDSPSYYRYVQQYGTVCPVGDCLYYHQYLYGTDYKQCGCGA